MPILPLDHPEPFAAVLGVMLYPGKDKDDRRKAGAFAAQWLAEPFRRFREIGGRLSNNELERLVMDGGALLSDLDDRWRGGLAAGELFKALFILAKNKPRLASWENAIRVYEISAKRAGSSGSRTELYQEKSRFLSVVHLWGAWSIREGNFSERLEVGYDGRADFQYFLAEAEILRDFGQNWRPSRAKSKPPLPPDDVWCVPSSWEPPPRQVTCDGKSRKVSTMEAMLLRLKDKALGRGGDLRALSLLIQLAQLYSEDELAAAAAATSADDANVLRIYRARLSSGAAAASESTSDNDQPKGHASGSTALAKTLETTPTKRVQVKRYRPSGDKPSADDADQHK